MRGFYALAVFVLCSLWALSQDWPQYQRNAARTGYTPVEVHPPFRARWIWISEELTLRNQLSEPGWPDNLTSVDGYDLPIPDSVPYTISQQVQPVISNGRLFFGTQDGKAYALSVFDGATLWATTMPGSVVMTAAVEGNIVVFTTLNGYVLGLNVQTGAVLWSVNTKYAITTAPCIHKNRVFTANHRGYARAIDLQTGTVLWQKRLSAPVCGNIAADGNTVYIPCEDMYVYALDIYTGNIRASNRAIGQGFRMTHPVVHNGRVWITSCLVPTMGSEWIMEEVMASSTDYVDEENNVMLWLQGYDNNGAWFEASPDWRHRFAYDTTDMSEAFFIPCGPTEGCGMPPESFVVDYQGRILCWWKTGFSFLSGTGSFGSFYSLDISAVNQTNGRRIIIDNGKLADIMQETDNLYAMSVAGRYLWLRQDFRGTQLIDLTTSDGRFVITPARNADGGGFDPDIAYLDWEPPFDYYKVGYHITSMQTFYGRTAPAIAANYVFIAENFGIVCIEHDPEND